MPFVGGARTTTIFLTQPLGRRGHNPAKARFPSPSPGGGGSRPEGTRGGVRSGAGNRSALCALSPHPAALRIADAPRRRSLRRRTAAEGRLSTFPLQGKVKIKNRDDF